MIRTLRIALSNVSCTAGCVLVALCGCQLAINPFEDSLSAQSPVTTPSVEGAREVTSEASTMTRGYESFSVDAPDGSVTHGPLYFEDWSEDSLKVDDAFAIGKYEYGMLFVDGGRFLVNIVFFPVSVIASPPWTVMTSDGHMASRCCCVYGDSERCNITSHGPSDSSNAGDDADDSASS